MTKEEQVQADHEQLSVEFDERIAPIVDRMRGMQTVSVQHMLDYIDWEMRSAMDSLPPDSQLRGKGEGDGFHAGCCVLRAYATLLKLRDRIGNLSI